MRKSSLAALTLVEPNLYECVERIVNTETLKYREPIPVAAVQQLANYRRGGLPFLNVLATWPDATIREAADNARQRIEKEGN